MSGLLCGLLLARLGKRVAIFGQDTRPKTIEILPPAALRAIIQCGLDYESLRSLTTENAGTLSLWGDQTPRATDYLLQAPGTGLQADRGVVDRWLAQNAGAAGAILLASNVSEARRAGNVWRLILKLGVCSEVEADTLVLANGRGGPVFGLATRRVTGGLIGISFQSQQCHSEARTWIEARPDGWWYSVPAPANQQAVVFFTDGRLRPDGARLPSWCRKSLEETQLISKRVQVLDPASARVMSAASSRLEKACGNAWIAVGDALAGFDPISSSGLRFAVESAMGAVRLLQGAWTQSDYVHWRDSIWNTYIKGLQAVYMLEQRWKDAPFWSQHSAGPKFSPVEIN